MKLSLRPILTSFFHVVLGVAVASGALAADLAAQLREEVESVLPALRTAGLTVAVGQQKRIVWSAGFGFADVTQQIPATPATVYRFASISKPITATAVMQLVEQGRVRLDAPLQDYMPDFPAKPEGPMTVRHLLTHTSGIRHYRGLEMFSARRYSSVVEALRIFQSDPLEFPPGTKYLYSSYGYNILAGVVEQAAGATFRTYLQARIFAPALMNSTDLEHLEEAGSLRAVQYLASGNGFVPAPTVDLSSKWAGGGIAGTAEDLVRFCQALQRGGLLRPDSLARCHARGQLADGRAIDYGLGWRMVTDSQRRVWATHSGGATGGTTMLYFCPDRGVAVALLANVQSVKGLGNLALRLGTLALSPE